MFDWINLENIDIYSPWVIIALVVAGFITGIINTIAGSGSIVNFSLFTFLGLPANVANGSMRLGVVMQTFASSLYFLKHKKLAVKTGLIMGVPIIIGTVLGAMLAAEINEKYFERIIIIVMILMLITLFWKPEKWISGHAEKAKEKPTYFQLFIYFIIGIYGGFIHIGVGIFMLAAMVLISGYDLVIANGLKVFTVFLYTPFALLVFIYEGQIDYYFGLISALGNLAGGIVASHMAVHKGAGFIRWFLIVVVILFITHLLSN
jgi:uncharacterized protein